MKYELRQKIDDIGNFVYDVETKRDIRARFFNKDDAEKFLKECHREEFKIEEVCNTDDEYGYKLKICSEKEGSIAVFMYKDHAEAFFKWLENGC